MTGSGSCFIIALALSLASVAPTLARTNQTRTKADQPPELTEASTLSEQVVKLYNAGRYKDALPRAQRALELREKALGKDDILLASVALSYSEDAAVTAARQWRFQTTTSGGVPVRVIGTITFKFEM